tara:strand:+ start:101 stop:460 length:360 start_codon:yes stop_codon:yes gene_type:complete
MGDKLPKANASLGSILGAVAGAKQKASKMEQSIGKLNVSNGLLHAAIKKYEAEILESVATLEIYFTNAVAIGEHPDLLAEVDKYTEKLESATGKLEVLLKHFTTKQDREDNRELLNERT